MEQGEQGKRYDRIVKEQIASSNGETFQHTVRIFAAVEIEPTMKLVLVALAVNYAVKGPVFAADSDSFSEEIDIAVAIARIGTGTDEHSIAVIGIVYCGLDVVEIGGTVVVNGYDSAGGCVCRTQQEH
jgi:hypothetical protein